MPSQCSYHDRFNLMHIAKNMHSDIVAMSIDERRPDDTGAWLGVIIIFEVGFDCSQHMGREKRNVFM